MSEKFLTAYETAWKLTLELPEMKKNFNIRNVYRWLNAKKLPGIKIAGEWRVPEGELVRWIAEKKGIKRDVDYVF